MALTRQIEYYFSPKNLHRDIYLRSLMDNDGYVNIAEIVKFNRIRELLHSLPATDGDGDGDGDGDTTKNRKGYRRSNGKIPLIAAVAATSPLIEVEVAKKDKDKDKDNKDEDRTTYRVRAKPL